MPPRLSEEKILWLLAHREFWVEKTCLFGRLDPDSHYNYMVLYRAMKRDGLYSEKTYAYDAHLERLIAKARIQLTSTIKETRNGRRKNLSRS